MDLDQASHHAVSNQDAHCLHTGMSIENKIKMEKKQNKNKQKKKQNKKTTTTKKKKKKKKTDTFKRETDSPNLQGWTS